jgi:hypothetical protein
MSLKDDKQQNIQMELDFSSALTGATRGVAGEETESPMATNEPENPARTNRWMEEVWERENLKEALRQVKGNKGSAGIDGVTVDQLTDYLKQHWPVIREQLLNGTYEPKPVRRVEIPKPDGGVRKLGIPTVLDRFIQQAVMQVLQRRWDRTFSEHSYGFRPGRSAHQAVAQAQQGRGRSEYRRSKIACYKERLRGSWKRCSRRISWSARMDFGRDVIPMVPSGRYAGSSSRRRLDTCSRLTSAATLTTSSMNGCRRWLHIGLQTRSSCA